MIAVKAIAVHSAQTALSRGKPCKEDIASTLSELTPGQCFHLLHDGAAGSSPIDGTAISVFTVDVLSELVLTGLSQTLS